jgi:hypothetical protein
MKDPYYSLSQHFSHASVLSQCISAFVTLVFAFDPQSRFSLAEAILLGTRMLVWPLLLRPRAMVLLRCVTGTAVDAEPMWVSVREAVSVGFESVAPFRRVRPHLPVDRLVVQAHDQYVHQPAPPSQRSYRLARVCPYRQMDRSHRTFTSQPRCRYPQ